MVMIIMNVPDTTARNILYCLNEVFDNSCNPRLQTEIIEDKMRIKRAMHRADGRSKDTIVDFRLDDMMKRYGYEKKIKNKINAF